MDTGISISFRCNLSATSFHIVSHYSDVLTSLRLQCQPVVSPRISQPHQIEQEQDLFRDLPVIRRSRHAFQALYWLPSAARAPYRGVLRGCNQIIVQPCSDSSRAFPATLLRARGGDNHSGVRRLFNPRALRMRQIKPPSFFWNEC